MNHRNSPKLKAEKAPQKCPLWGRYPEQMGEEKENYGSVLRMPVLYVSPLN